MLLAYLYNIVIVAIFAHFAMYFDCVWLVLLAALFVT